MDRAHSFKSAAQPSPTAANLPLPPGAQNSASSASARTSGRRANGPEKGLNAESMDVEQLISALDHYTRLAAKATKDRAAQLTLRNDANAFKHYLDIRLDDAITASGRGDGEAVKTLVTIAAADCLVGDLAAKARAAIDGITRSPAEKTGAASNSVDTIRTAISSLQEAYGAHMGDGTKAWVDSALRMSLSNRQAQIPTAQGRASVGASAASQPAGEAVNRRLETPESSEARRPTRDFFSDEQLLPAMVRMKGDRFVVLSTGDGTTFPSGGNVTDQVEAMVRSAFAKQNKPAVTLYHQADHWVAIIAMPPAADAQNAKPSLVIFDSNAKQDAVDLHHSQKVGPTIAAALNRAGYEVHAAFGFIQEGMAANGCGPLCVAAIDAAFGTSSAAEPVLTAEVIAKRLNQYIQDFSSADQNRRDQKIAFAEAFIQSSSPQASDASAAQSARRVAAPPISRALSDKNSEALVTQTQNDLHLVRVAKTRAEEELQKAKQALPRLQPELLTRLNFGYYPDPVARKTAVDARNARAKSLEDTKVQIGQLQKKIPQLVELLELAESRSKLALSYEDMVNRWSGGLNSGLSEISLVTSRLVAEELPAWENRWDAADEQFRKKWHVLGLGNPPTQPAGSPPPGPSQVGSVSSAAGQPKIQGPSQAEAAAMPDPPRLDVKGSSSRGDLGG